MTLFYQYLLRHSSISVNEIDFVASFFRKEVLKASECFIRQGNTSAKLAFVEEGVLKTNYTYSEEETIRSFSQKNNWIGHWESFIGQKPSPNSVYAVSNCQLVTITRHGFQRLEEELANGSTTLRKAIFEELQAAWTNPYKRIEDPKERYEKFIQAQPEVAFELSTENIATYLQIPHELLLQVLCETLFFYKSI